MRYAAALCALALCGGPATAQTATEADINDHRAAVAAYVATVPLALLADDVCPGIQANGQKILVLRATANVFDREEDAAKLEMERVEAGARQVIARTGAAAWCREVWSQIGPGGSRLAGLLARH